MMLTIAVAITIMLYLVILTLNFRNAITKKSAEERASSLLAALIGAVLLGVLIWAYLD